MVRGTYHNVTFAKWWSMELDRLVGSYQAYGDANIIELDTAVMIQFTMSNDVSRVKGDYPGRLPYFI